MLALKILVVQLSFVVPVAGNLVKQVFHQMGRQEAKMPKNKIRVPFLWLSIPSLFPSLYS